MPVSCLRPLRGAACAAACALAAFLAGSGFQTPVLAAPAGFVDLAMIDLAVARFTGRAIGVPGGAAQPIDRRLRLAACHSPLLVGWRNAGLDTRLPARDSVVVRCPDGGGWRLYVPLAQAPALAEGASAPLSIQRGEAVTIAIRGEGFSVEQGGEALDAGAAGAWIRVRTAPRADPLRARIVRPGLVEVPVE